MRFKLTSEAKKYLNALDNDSIKRLYAALRALTKDPPTGDVKPLVGKAGLYRLRVGEWRMLFEYDGNNIIVSKIGPRGDVYK
jgi:mRNA interferase RelE/StbE